METSVAIATKYLPEELLAVGGMAEIHLARQVTADGFGRQVVLKRLKSDLLKDSRVCTMFWDEARIGSFLNHPHVVQMFDTGEFAGAPLIAMEYIRGEELSALCLRALEVGFFLPLSVSVELVRQAAMALGYVHSLQDEQGVSLKLVHCDISPNNLLVTAEGHLKLIDFGIARASGNRYQETAAVPGKLSYMAPEQILGKVVDGRADIFSLAVVLYELSAGRRLFRGPASEVKDRIVSGDITPPTFFRSDYPSRLEAIVMRALEKDPIDRFASAYEFASQLEEFQKEVQMSSGSLWVARYLDELAQLTGQPPRTELYPEARTAGMLLDFDRGLFANYKPIDQAMAQVTEWDDPEQDKQEVAAVLGIDPGLVRTAAVKASGAQASGEHASSVGRETKSQPVSSGASAAKPAKRGTLPLWLVFAMGIALGAVLAYPFLR